MQEWEKTRIFNYKDRLRELNHGCPWPASIIALVYAAQGAGAKSERVLNSAKVLFGYSEEDIMIILKCFESREFESEAVKSIIDRRVYGKSQVEEEVF